jgi:hypothetical protein
MEGNKIIKKVIDNYAEIYKISDNKKKKIIKICTMLACRFYVEEQLDSLVIEELLEEGNLDYSIKTEKGAVDEY